MYISLTFNYIDLLDFCDSENRSHIVDTEKQLLETEFSTELEEDLNIAIGAEDNIEDEDEKFDEENNIDDNEDSEQDMDDGSLLINENSDQDNSEDIPEETNDINTEKYPTANDKDEMEDEESTHILEESTDGLWEDIYGRQRDKKGNIVSKKYLPPAARVTSTDIPVDDEKVRRLEKQLKGILNRLAEQNMHTIGNQVFDYKCICNYICN